MKRSTIALTGVVAGVAGYVAFIRPWHLRWGSKRYERGVAWPGTEFMPHPVTHATRAITINATAEQVWPWLAQIGQDRGGFYSYTPLENLIGAGMRNADEIHRDWQHREEGDRVWLGDPSKFGGSAYMIVARWIRGQAIVLVTQADWDRLQQGKRAREGVWSFHIEPIDGRSCRLIARTLSGWGLSAAQKAANYIFWEPAHFVMERAMLQGVKRRAESVSNDAPAVCVEEEPEFAGIA